MNEDIIRRLREPGLRIAMRGYDRLEVDALLHDTADMIEARGVGVETPAAAVGELPGVGERVESIIKAATDAAEHVNAQSAKRASEVTQEAEQAAEHARREADSYATETRESADRYAAETRTEAETAAASMREEAERLSEASTAAAEEQAAEILREAATERDRVKASIAELRQQRQSVIESIERMRGNLDSMVGGASQGTEQFIALGEGEEELAEARPITDEEEYEPLADEPLATEPEPSGVLAIEEPLADDEEEVFEEDEPITGEERYEDDELGEDDYEDEEAGELVGETRKTARTRTATTRPRSSRRPAASTPRRGRARGRGRGLGPRGRRRAGARRRRHRGARGPRGRARLSRPRPPRACGGSWDQASQPRANWPWNPNGMWCGASARASSRRSRASRTSRNERSAAASRTTESSTPSSSSSAPGRPTKTGSPGQQPGSLHAFRSRVSRSTLTTSESQLEAAVGEAPGVAVRALVAAAVVDPAELETGIEERLALDLAGAGVDDEPLDRRLGQIAIRAPQPVQIELVDQ